MLATLIEIDRGCPPAYWYHHLAGRRLWCTPGRETLAGDCWKVVPGQGIADSGTGVIWAEHAWTVCEGEVETVLIEIEPRSRQMEARV